MSHCGLCDACSPPLQSRQPHQPRPRRPGPRSAPGTWTNSPRRTPTPTPPAAGAEVIVAGEGRRVDPARVPGVLAGRGLTRLLTEGGPLLLGQFASAGVLDELCLSLAPLVASGTSPRIVNGPPMAVPERFVL